MREESGKHVEADASGVSGDPSPAGNLIVSGAGYVGLATATGFARKGHHIDLVEVDPYRVQRLRLGEIPFSEPSLEASFMSELKAGNITVHDGYEKGLPDADFAFICTPTPPKEDGQLDTSYVYSAAGSLMDACGGPIRLVIRSTVGPGTSRDLEAWTQSKRPEVAVLVNPEFLREGSSLHDFESPSRIVVGGSDPAAIEALSALYAFADCERIGVDSVTAELIKLGSNSTLAVRVSLANELAHLAQSLGADVEAVLSGVGADSRIGRAYLSPGIGFGGACLPKDLSALRTAAMLNGVQTAVFDGAQRTNEVALERLISELSALRNGNPETHVAVIGVAFKSGSDSVRDSRAVSLVKSLVRENFKVTIFDPLAEEAARRELCDSVNYAASLKAALDACSIGIIIDQALLGPAEDLAEPASILMDSLGRRIAAR